MTTTTLKSTKGIQTDYVCGLNEKEFSTMKVKLEKSGYTVSGIEEKPMYKTRK